MEDRCLNVTCVQGENGKSISTIDSTQATEAHDTDTDSDLARLSDGKHPSAQHDTPAMLLRSATRRSTPAMSWRTRVPVTRSEATVERWMEAAQTTRSSRRSRRTGGGSGPTTSIRSAGGASTNRMTAETLGVRADIACVIHMCTLCQHDLGS